jgi:hypothetical protein
VSLLAAARCAPASSCCPGSSVSVALSNDCHSVAFRPSSSCRLSYTDTSPKCRTGITIRIRYFDTSILF